MRVEDSADLAPLTTLQLGGRARRLVTAETDADVTAEVAACDARGEPVFVLGGGSNVVIGDGGWDGTVIRVATGGIAVDDVRSAVTVAAGESWDGFVAWAVADGRAGVECLSGIPGLVGAVPIQNVGAYGQDVSQSIVRVDAWDRERGARVTIAPRECAFAYRTSAFKGRARHVILSVTFALERAASSRPIRYAELARALGVGELGSAPLAQVRETVLSLRRAKGMVTDPADPDSVSAGSFFTNPILTEDEVARMLARLGVPPEGVPLFPEPEGRSKVSAGWLIERAGFPRGFGQGRVGVSRKHALALTNRGGATTAELLVLARTIRDGVRRAAGVTLECEPVFIGASLDP